MKSVLMSIQPKWCELIANGKKTVEVRKTRPKCDVPFKVYIYCTNSKDMLWILKERNSEKIASIFSAKDVGGATKANGKVIGEFVCDSIVDCRDINMDCTCLTVPEWLQYTKGHKGNVWGWHISDFVIYDKPKELGEFVTHCKYEFTDDFRHCEDCQHYYYSNTPSCGTEEYCGCDGLKPITRPPQSWCYVEGGEQ